MKSWRAFAVALLAASPVHSQEPPSLGMADLQRTGDLICDLYKSGPYARRSRSPDMLLIFDRVGVVAGTARVFSSRKVGAQPVRIYAGATGLHFVQDLNGSVIVTTLLGCNQRSAAGRCTRYSTVNAWHFDERVHRHPDIVFRQLPGTSYSGACEAWYMEDRRRAAVGADGLDPAQRADVFDGASAQGR